MLRCHASLQTRTERAWLRGAGPHSKTKDLKTLLSTLVPRIIDFLTFWILLSYLVPISLFVTLEIVKFWQVKRELFFEIQDSSTAVLSFRAH